MSQGYVVIPKSVEERRIQSNATVFGFELDEEDMQEVSLR
jgi:diketogulonate reductase-like aldo/keto reductase